MPQLKWSWDYTKIVSMYDPEDDDDGGGGGGGDDKDNKVDRKTTL